jgi:ubiquinol-cytochrome c reductase cytochrome c subunit
MTGRRAVRVGRIVALSAIGLVPLAGVMVWTGNAAGRPALQASPAPSDLSFGQTVYEERCATCHGPQGTGTVQAPPLVGLGPAAYDFMMSTGRMPLDQPGAQAKRRRPVLSPTAIRAVTAFLTSLGPRGIPIPHVDIGAGNLSDGQKLYEDTCAPCHSTSGNGGAVGTLVAPNLHQATPTQIGEAVRIGPGTMPRFGPATLDSLQLDSLSRYVVYLRKPNDRGGSGLDHVGPLIEGFVALGIGLGLMLVATRWIGTRS